MCCSARGYGGYDTIIPTLSTFSPYYNRKDELERVVQSIRDSRDWLATAARDLEAAVGDFDALMQELQPLLEPVMKNGDPSAQAAHRSYNDFTTAIR